MHHFENRKQLFRASDSEIEAFFENVRFEGLFTPEVRNTSHPEYFKGSVTDIKLNGAHYDYLPQFLNIPKLSSFVSYGPCTFKCRVNTAALHDSPQKLILTVIGNSLEPLHPTKRQTTPKRKERTKEEAIFLRNLKLKDNLFIGQFTMNRDGSFTIRDIRRSDFSKLILQNGKEQNPIVYHPKKREPKDGIYYEFAWVLNKVVIDDYVYNFKVDEAKPFKEISAKELISRLHNDIMSYPAGAGQKIVKMLDTLKTQLTASGKEIFIYELLQNANDYPVKDNNVTEKVDVEFRITADSLVFMHSGAKFNERNIAAICSINDKEKTENKEAIGYKGIGFKTVFLDNNYVYLQTGDFSFRFDREATRDIVDTPWQILPIWTNYNKLTPSEKYIFTNADSKFRVKFALRPTNIDTLRGEGQNYVKLFQKVFENERVILFIPNLSSVKVFYNYTDEPDIECRCDTDKWRVDNFEEPVNPDLTIQINDDIDKQEDSGSLKIPTKYYDFTRTKVSFACEVDGSLLNEVKDTLLYCYLPTKASWGFKFLMNTDMIPTGPRDDIEIDFNDQININAEISEIAGRKFFDWIRKLCDSKNYVLTSIFNLIPVFDTCIREHGKYKSLIERFKSGFDAKIEEEKFIPVGINEYELLSNTLLDETGFMSSGIMSDDDFYNIAGVEGKLPLLILRKDSNFKAFQKRYLKQFGCTDNIWTIDDLKNLCADEDFKNWILNPDNNNLFLKFLLDKGYLEEFFNEEIFMEEDGSIHAAKDLFYDVDAYISDLLSFKDMIPVLSSKTRAYFSENDEWDDTVKNAFTKFNCDDWVNDVLLSNLNIEETRKRLQDLHTSIHFFKFLAENVDYCDNYLSLPFFSDGDTVCDGFENGFIFFTSERGKSICEAEWLSTIQITFLSGKYYPVTNEYFKDFFGVLDFSDEVFVKNILLSEDYHDEINTKLYEDYDTSKKFVDYCYSQKELFESGDLRKFSLHVYDNNGDGEWALSEDHIYFQSEQYDELSAKEWIGQSWMYVLDEEYLKGHEDDNEFKQFLVKKFWVDEISDKRFYKDVVKKNLKLIFQNISGENDAEGVLNFDFIKYLDNNYQLIFVEEKDSDAFDGLKVVTSDMSYIDVNNGNLYLFDNELDGIMSKSWFPSNTVFMCHSEYGISMSLKAIGVKQYNFGTFYDDVIVNKLSLINKEIATKEDSIDFHSYIIERLNSLTPDQQSKMTSAKVYLYGQEIASEYAGGHKTLSAKAKELFDSGLVEFSDLDIIDPEYKTEDNVNYWEVVLGNTKFTVNHFFSWLDKNVQEFNQTLQDANLNIVFWRWMKSNVGDKLIEQTSILPVLLKDGSIDEISSTIYLADEYLNGSGIEDMIKVFDEDAHFISPLYIASDDTVQDWKAFWEKVGVKYEIIDILDHTVIRKRLSETEVENLPRLLSENREALEKRFSDGLISHLHTLRVKAHDGQFYAIGDTIYVNCEKEEPFPFIELPNQIVFDTFEERRLIKDIIEDISGSLIESLSDWQQYKLDHYLSIQNSNVDSIKDCHYDFIDALSVIRNSGHDSLRELKRVDEILILDKKDEFCKASDLTLGSVYNPFFDFEGCGIVADYVSDSYDSHCSEYVGRLFRSMGVHHDFEKDDVMKLAERDCSLYFWTKYLTKPDGNSRIEEVRRYISDGLFNDIACIPTKDYMMKPSDLYYGIDVNKYLKYIEDAENKSPLNDIPDIRVSDEKTLFGYLPFKKSLDFLDALYASIKLRGKESRVQLLEWMVDSYDESFETKIYEYREDSNALWKNNNNKDYHIKELYALDYGDKTLEQYFGTNARIINKDYLPTGDYYEQACNILHINIIKSGDLTMEPVDDALYHSRDIDLRLYALVISGIADNTNWKEKYNIYSERLNNLHLHKCSSIRITYSEDAEINQAFRKFYHKRDTDDFYFVDSLDNKRVYTLFVNEYKQYLGVTENTIAQELVEDIMDSRENAISLAKDQNALMLDEGFVAELERLIPSVKGVLKGNAVHDEELDTTNLRPEFTTKSDAQQSISSESADDGNDIQNVEQHSEHQHKEVDNQIPYIPSETHESQGDSAQSNIDNPTPDLESNTSSGQEIPRKKEFPHNTPSDEPIDTSEFESQPLEGDSDIFDASDYVPDNETYIGDVEDDQQYEPLGSKPHKPTSSRRRHPKPFTREELERMRSNNSPLELESLEPTKEELDVLSQCGISVEQIADTNFLAQLRLYNNLRYELHEDPEESLEDFIRNADDVSTHRMKSGKYIHACSAARGVMYISPSVWNKMVDDKWAICVYLDGKGKNFHFINTSEEFLKLVEKDDVVIKITGEEKVSVVEKLYGQSGLLKGVKGTAYTLIRVAARTNMDAVFAHYIGSMAESDDGNENTSDY